MFVVAQPLVAAAAADKVFHLVEAALSPVEVLAVLVVLALVLEEVLAVMVLALALVLVEVLAVMVAALALPEGGAV